MTADPVCVCRACAFLGTLSDAVGHYRATGHTLVYRGVDQDFSKLILQADEWNAFLAWREEALARGRAWSRTR